MNNSSIGNNWNDMRKDIFSPGEIAASDLRVQIISELIKLRKNKGLTQRDVEKISGVKQPIIARMEKGETSPQLDTILKVLAAQGKTLAVVPLNESV